MGWAYENIFDAKGKSEMTSFIVITVIVIGALSLRVGYYLGKKRALTDPQGDYIWAVFYLGLLKELKEEKYDTVKNGIAMRARCYVNNWRKYEQKLTDTRLAKIKGTIGHHELIENAEELCGPLDIIEISNNTDITN